MTGFHRAGHSKTKHYARLYKWKKKTDLKTHTEISGFHPHVGSTGYVHDYWNLESRHLIHIQANYSD